jgi:hypothetical protein
MAFCLDDGAELLYGPASMGGPTTAILSEPALVSGQFDEPQMAILHKTASPAETRAHIGPYTHDRADGDLAIGHQ